MAPDRVEAGWKPPVARHNHRTAVGEGEGAAAGAAAEEDAAAAGGKGDNDGSCMGAAAGVRGRPRISSRSSVCSAKELVGGRGSWPEQVESERVGLARAASGRRGRRHSTGTAPGSSSSSSDSSPFLLPLQLLR